MSMILHCGAEPVSREQVYNSVTPAPLGPTHFPIPHGRLLLTTLDAFERNGYQVEEEQHGLTKEDGRYFGLFRVQSRQDLMVCHEEQPKDRGLVVGLRNSHDMAFASSLAVGGHVFVCDNLFFSGEVKIARKHTRYIERDLAGLVLRAVGQISEYNRRQEHRIEAYQGHEIPGREVNDILIESLDRRAITGQQLPKVLKEWREPSHPEFKERNLWSLFNAYTEVMKGTSYELTLGRTIKLHGLFDLHCGLAV